MIGRSLVNVAIFLGVCVLTSPIYSSHDIPNNGVDKILAAIKRLIEFFKGHYQRMTLDTVFGLRVIEGQCKLLVEDFYKGHLDASSAYVMTAVNDLGTEAGKVANMAIPHLLEHDREYFGLLKELIVGPWKVFRPHRIVNPSLRWPVPLTPPVFSEIESNYCLTELMSDAKTGNHACNLTEDCLRKMFAPGQVDHYLQRQIFYIIVAMKMKCDAQVTDYLVARTHYKSVDQVQHEYCSNAFYELEESVAARGFSEDYLDLFLETEFLCPSLGYFQFVKRSWLDTILSWQSSSGCFPAETTKTLIPIQPYDNVVGYEKVQGKASILGPNEDAVKHSHLSIEEPNLAQVKTFQNAHEIHNYYSRIDDTEDGGQVREALPLPAHPLSKYDHGQRQHFSNDALPKHEQSYIDHYVPQIVPHYEEGQPEVHHHKEIVHIAVPQQEAKHNVHQHYIDNRPNIVQYQHNRGLKSINPIINHVPDTKVLWKDRTLAGLCT